MIPTRARPALPRHHLRACAVALALAYAGPLDGQACTTLTTRASLGAMSGAPIAAVHVAPGGMVIESRLPVAGALHANTRPAVVRRQLLFAAGDTVDTLAIAETLRRLRQAAIIDDATIEARRCEGSPDVALTVRTRDTWSLQPTLALRSLSEGVAGFEEQNLFGTARSLLYLHEVEDGKHGDLLRLADPAVFGSRVSAWVRASGLARRRGVLGIVRRRELRTSDVWRGELVIASLRRSPSRLDSATVRTAAASAVGGRRVAGDGRSVVSVLFGGEWERVRRDPGPRAAGAREPESREFLGADVGVLVRTVAYDTVGWFVPRDGLVDVPQGTEGEVIVGLGRDRLLGAPAARYDLWAGRMWSPRRALVVLDGWASGYAAPGRRAQYLTRATLGAYAAARRGVWRGRLAAEASRRRDADLRVVSLLPYVDPALAVIGGDLRTPSRGAAASIERAVHVRPVAFRSTLDVAAFVAGTWRAGTPASDAERAAAAVVGVSLQLVPATSSLVVSRLDLAYPIARVGHVAARPRVGVRFGLPYENVRQLDARRLR